MITLALAVGGVIAALALIGAGVVKLTDTDEREA